ncbi:sugar kinase [Iningainema tapete]|uniref:Sugar kinase n=1 Tax=Iningainema tapete BLCC-T55 TaxID=2748662 RepID=A0A8J7C8R9_9CYAN|nr:sugar kinase [Iningainema tapete]MBD2775036.1 sugar kinase [Iningainema tapete BLCC-T55]
MTNPKSAFPGRSQGTRQNPKYHGLFVGLVTLDLIYLADNPPSNNQKIVASDYTVAAGGPATNAAVTFSYLNRRDAITLVSTVMGVVGSHPMTQLIKGDLIKYGVVIADLNDSTTQPPPVSSIIVTQTTGERAVISINAVKTQASREAITPEILENIDIVLIDGHQMSVGSVIAQMAKAKNIPVVIDGGSWKPGFEQILPFVDYAICSANFSPPGCQSESEVLAYLKDIHIPHIAITHGDKPIQYLTGSTYGYLDVPNVQAVDTLGAGDVFHGAFCHYILQENFTTALSLSAQIASLSCQYFGTRRWMDNKEIKIK